MEETNWKERLAKLEGLFRSAPQITVIGTHFDADLAASMAGIEKIGQHHGKIVELRSNAEPRREQDKLIAKLFRLHRFLPIEEGAAYPFTVLVDSPSFNNKLYSVRLDTKPNVIIDHHDMTDEEEKEIPKEDETSWYWHDSYGACASMVGKLLLDFSVPFKTPTDNTATLILLGIFSDTANLTSLYTRNLDRRIVASLGEYATQETVHLVSSSTISPKFIRVLNIATAEGNCFIGKKTMFVWLGEKPKGDDEFTDASMPKIANMFLNTTGISEVYVAAIDDDNNQLIVKARNSNTSKGEKWFNQHLKELFGDNAGAKHGAEGGANIDLGPVGRTRNRSALADSWKDYLADLLVD